MTEFNRVNVLPWKFFLITFGISWLIWLPGVLDATKIVDLHLSNDAYVLLNLIGGFAPTVTGLLLLYIEKGKDAVKNVLKSAIDYRNIGKGWWILIFILFPLIEFIALLLNVLCGGTVPEMPLIMEPWLILIVFIGSLLPFSNAFREEFGWRGYALDKMQNKWDAVSTSVLIGFMWGIWHWPLYFFPTAQIVYGYIPLWRLVVGAILYSCLMTWIYNNTNKSMLSAILLHSMANLSGSIFLNYLTEYGANFSLILRLVLIICIIFVFGYKTMVRSDSILNEVEQNISKEQ